ncbi:MAG: S8 family serine peptidase [Candidatus Contubernalis sp.]|nr:S8 family serine peptidase [Candidatus Contubernalis sp.]
MEKDYDFFKVETSPDGSNWDSFYSTSELPSGFQLWTGDFTRLYDLFDQFYFRFHLTSDASNTYDGIYIDNMILVETPLLIDTHTDTFLCGTSMAAPVVSGIAGLVKSMRPWLTASNIRNVIISSVDPLPSLSGYVSTGGRVNAYKAVTYNNPPSKPSNLLPLNNSTDVSLVPGLSASIFSDPEGDSHSQAQWQITTTSGNYSVPVWDHISSTDLISATVPSSLLNYSTIYYWRVRYQDNYDGGTLWSSWSEQTSFTTQSAPSSSGGGGGGGGGPVGPLAAGISALLGWWKRRKQGKK